jgi:hypothetical protein
MLVGMREEHQNKFVNIKGGRKWSYSLSDIQVSKSTKWCHDAQQYDTQYNDIKLSHSKHNVAENHNEKCHAE